MRIFVTGATGFLGYHFVNVAVVNGHDVLCLRRSTSVSLFEKIIEEKIQWISNDDENVLLKTLNCFQPDVLFHAAWSGVRGQGRNDEVLQQKNVELSKRIISLYPYKQIIALGSQAEYGYYEGIVSESHFLKPNTPYGKAKKEVCKLLKSYCESHNIEWQWIRIFTVFGEMQTGGLIRFFTEQCLSGKNVFDTTDGKQEYSYMYSFDYARALCNVLGSTGKSGIYNLCNTIDILSNRALLEKIKNITKSNININYGAVPYEPDQIMYMCGLIDKFEKSFGNIHFTHFDEAINHTISSIKENFSC